LRIAVGGFLHESHSFVGYPTGLAEFEKPGGFAPLCRGQEMVEALYGSSVAAASMIDALQVMGHQVVPLLWCFAMPSGPVTDAAFESILSDLVDRLEAAHHAKPLDGVLLDLHGAMVTPAFPDAEGEILRRVRIVVGSEVPIVAALDPHANMTAQMVAMADALTPYRTYPHVDMSETGRRAVSLLMTRILHKEPFHKAFKPIDFLIPITAQCTMVEPMLGLMRERFALANRDGVAELALCFGFPYCDFAGCGPALAAFGPDEAAVEAALAALADTFNHKESQFAGGVVSAAEGVRRAIALARNAGKPVILADTQDNPGGGGHGDTTGLLAELIRQNAHGAVLGLLNDPQAADICHQVGEGGTVSLQLGGRSVAPPLSVEVEVLRLSDGRFTCTGPMARGNKADLGASALIRVTPGIDVVLVSRKMQAHDQAAFMHLGVDPERCAILALKSSVHFRAHFQPIAADVILVAAPGPVVSDPASLPFKHLRPGLRLRPAT
jgi:microcystin degradation protein MlrC